MFDGIVVNIIHCRPKMAFRFHRGLRRIAPDLPASLVFFAIPLKRSSTVHFAQSSKRDDRVPRCGEKVVVIRQNHPSVQFFAILFDDGSKRVFKFYQSWDRIADDRLMLETRRSEKVPTRAVGIPMRGTVPRAMLGLTPFQNLPAHSIRHGSPRIHVGVHALACPWEIQQPKDWTPTVPSLWRGPL